MAHIEGHKMVMGSKEKNTPGNFSSRDNDLILAAPQLKRGLHYLDGSKEGDTRGTAAGMGSGPNSPAITGKTLTSANVSQKSDYTKGYLKGLKSGMGEKKVNRVLKKADRKRKKEEKVANRSANQAARIGGRLDKTQRKGEAATKAGKLQKARRLQARKQRLLKRQK
jgi:hypothetical protein|tara:strand:+ start:1346 stop:1846 length:501 start_codon:yes stop_codon:yes gene_type:complete